MELCRVTTVRVIRTPACLLAGNSWRKRYIAIPISFQFPMVSVTSQLTFESVNNLINVFSCNLPATVAKQCDGDSSLLTLSCCLRRKLDRSGHCTHISPSYPPQRDRCRSRSVIGLFLSVSVFSLYKHVNKCTYQVVLVCLSIVMCSTHICTEFSDCYWQLKFSSINNNSIYPIGKNYQVQF